MNHKSSLAAALPDNRKSKTETQYANGGGTGAIFCSKCKKMTERSDSYWDDGKNHLRKVCRTCTLKKGPHSEYRCVLDFYHLGTKPEPLPAACDCANPRHLTGIGTVGDQPPVAERVPVDQTVMHRMITRDEALRTAPPHVVVPGLPVGIPAPISVSSSVPSSSLSSSIVSPFLPPVGQPLTMSRSTSTVSSTTGSQLHVASSGGSGFSPSPLSTPAGPVSLQIDALQDVMGGPVLSPRSLLMQQPWSARHQHTRPAVASPVYNGGAGNPYAGAMALASPASPDREGVFHFSPTGAMAWVNGVFAPSSPQDASPRLMRTAFPHATTTVTTTTATTSSTLSPAPPLPVAVLVPGCAVSPHTHVPGGFGGGALADALPVSAGDVFDDQQEVKSSYQAVTRRVSSSPPLRGLAAGLCGVCSTAPCVCGCQVVPELHAHPLHPAPAYTPCTFCASDVLCWACESCHEAYCLECIVRARENSKSAGPPAPAVPGLRAGAGGVNLVNPSGRKRVATAPAGTGPQFAAKPPSPFASREVDAVTQVLAAGTKRRDRDDPMELPEAKRIKRIVEATAALQSIPSRSGVESIVHPHGSARPPVAASAPAWWPRTRGHRSITEPGPGGFVTRGGSYGSAPSVSVDTMRYDRVTRGGSPRVAARDAEVDDITQGLRAVRVDDEGARLLRRIEAVEQRLRSGERIASDEAAELRAAVANDALRAGSDSETEIWVEKRRPHSAVWVGGSDGNVEISEDGVMLRVNAGDVAACKVRNATGRPMEVRIVHLSNGAATPVADSRVEPRCTFSSDRNPWQVCGGESRVHTFVCLYRPCGAEMWSYVAADYFVA